MYVYMKVTRDKFELPVAIADSPKELAKMVGSTANTINSAVNKYERGVHKTSKYIRVKIEECE